jgi:nitroreductase
MDIRVSAWNHAIFTRKSRRSFQPGRPIEPETFDQLERLCREFRPFPGVRVELVRRPPDDVFRGFVGGYGKITGARAYLVFIGEGILPETPARLGYIGEAAILEATSLGLGTCWVAGFFLSDAVAADIQIAPCERIYAVSPLGYAEGSITAKEKLYSGLSGSKSRRVSSTLVISGTPDEWQKAAFEAARLAPSAVNRQPWRFVFEPGRITIRVDGTGDGAKIPKRLDCGIAMLHVEIAARAAGIDGKWEFLPLPDVARFERNGSGRSVSDLT